MPALNLDFGRIREFGGSKHHAFEELCAQLASLEPRVTGTTFYRKGPGADAGVECYLRHNDGKETAWQAKYFDKLDASQIGQLDKSIEQALEKHPQLTRYIVCLPLNPRDERSGKSQSELQRWQAWVKKWQSKPRKPKFKIELWGRTELLERLGRDDPLYSGRAAFWFDETFLTARWFQERFAIAREGLGERYTPETNIKLPIRRALLGFCRDPSITKELETWWQRVEEQGPSALSQLEHLSATANLTAAIKELRQAVESLSSQLAAIPPDPAANLPLDKLKQLTEAALVATARAQRAAWDLRPDKKQDQERVQYTGYSLRKLEDILDKILSALTSDQWSIVNSRRLLAKGAAGVGKSHLFADAVDHLVQNGRPALLILSGSLIEDDPWSQIIKQLGLDVTAETLLGALDAAAQAAGTRAVIFVDAINEHHGIALWAQRLPGFLKSIERFPRVALALSCRTTYLPYILVDGVEKQLSQIEHVGFAGRAAEAARYYLDRRGIARMAAPNLVPEFENPLFLKTCCDYLEKENLKEIPRGLRGVTEIFAFYTQAVAKAVDARLGLDRNLKIVPRALEAFAQALDNSERGYLDYDKAAEVLDPFFPSHGQFQRSLVAQLTSEGVLATEPVATEEGGVKQIVRFTFERYSDHRVARRLLDEHIDAADPAASFAAGKPLNAYLNDDSAYEYAGVIEAMAIQLPERCGLELLDALPKPHRNIFILAEALVDSALWRAQKAFTKRTLELLSEASRCTGEDEAMKALISVTTEPDNAFNAYYLDQLLKKKTLTDRDAQWSIYVARTGDDDDSPIETLIAWTLQNGLGSVDDDRAELAAIALAWLFTTSHRRVRDRATKALASLFAPRLKLAAAVVKRFAGVDDLYVLDRLFAAAYGGALQGVSADGLPDLAQAAFSIVFDRDIPVVHVMVRDYARGIVELAHARGMLPATVDLARCRPPYQSEWPLDDVPESVIKTYVQVYPGGHRMRDDIVGSVINDGDFARYIIDGAVDDFSPLPIAWAGRPEEAIYRDWEAELVRDNPNAAEKLIALLKLCLTWREQQGPLGFLSSKIKIKLVKPGEEPKDRRSAIEKKVDRAEAALAKALGGDGWKRYQIEARSFVRGDLRGAGRIYLWPPQFDTRFARRWICKRAHDFGWTPEKFGEFDRHSATGGDRHNHRIERVGKKYQWMAFHELIARLGDNCAFIGWSRQDGTRVFQGPWEIHRRDIDPSLFAVRSQDDDWRQGDFTWWLPVRVDLKPVSPHSRVQWLKSDEDVVNGPELLAVTDPTTGREWFVIGEYANWNQWGVREGDRKLDRTMFVYIRCLLTRASDRDRLVKALSDRSLLGSHNLPEVERPSESYIGEYPWHPLFAGMPIWVAPSSWNEIGVESQPTVTEYLAERGGHDYSIEETFRFNLPSPGIVAGMKLHLSNGQGLAYASDDNEIRFFDPSVKEPGPSAALVDRAAFLDFLAREKLSPVWIVTGEKSAYGGLGYHSEGFGGRTNFTSIYWLTDTGFGRSDFHGRDVPSPDQLAKLYAETTSATKPTAKRKPKLASKKPSPKQARGTPRRKKVGKKAKKSRQRNRKKRV